ncbi:hypothetical protein C8F01DRAFT_1123157 [Mycena amicta]|nr:hypothetical protein C8F01DRAFT_1123157 [Mycena amicta]
MTRIEIAQDVLSGKTAIVSHPGTSQYSAAGIAACGLASLNFVRVALARVEAGIIGIQLLEDLISRETSEEVISICSRWPFNGHLEVEDIAKVPLFERALDLDSSIFNIPSFQQFQSVLNTLKSLPSKYAAVVVTRPPEIVSCLKLPIESTDGQQQEIFVIFDSHPRPTHPDGAGFIVNSSLDAAAAHLDNLLAVDDRLLTDRGLQWQTQLLANFSGHFFIPKGRIVNTLEEMTKAVMDSSLVALMMQAEVAELKLQNAALSRDRLALEAELDELRAKHSSSKQKQKQPSSSLNSPRPQSYRDAAQPLAGPSKVSDRQSASAKNALEYFHNPTNIQRPPRAKNESSDFLMAQQMQMDVDSFAGPSSRRMKRANRRRSHHRPDDENDFMLAAKLQSQWNQQDQQDVARAREYEAEYARLTAERAALEKLQQKVFKCPLCLEELPEDDVAFIHNCDHKICRECMKRYVASKLTDKIYPIFCPSCLAETSMDPGMVTDNLVQILGLSDAQYQILQELQIASLSTLIHCRKCKEGVFVDRGEHDAAENIACPLPRCNFVWCKACQQEITMGGPKHSCDGSSEMDHLLAQKGWRRCPGCQTAFQKSSGCNHMTCMAPGCNSHWCYLCGDLIVRSALPKEIRAGVSSHYRRCQLFEDVPER